MKSRSDTITGWIEEKSRDARFRAEVERMLNEMRVRQDLIALREARGLSQAQVAKLLGVRNRQEAAELVVDLLGPAALFTTDDPQITKDVHEMLLNRCLSIAGGTTQILRNVVAERSGRREGRCLRQRPLQLLLGAVRRPESVRPGPAPRRCCRPGVRSARGSSAPPLHWGPRTGRRPSPTRGRPRRA